MIGNGTTMSAYSGDVEDFILTPNEQAAGLARFALDSVKPYHEKSANEFCKVLLSFEELAKQQMKLESYLISAIYYWRFIALYRDQIHILRTSRKIPLRMKSLLDEKASIAVTAIKWIHEKLKEKKNMSIIRHLKDSLRMDSTVVHGIHTKAISNLRFKLFTSSKHSFFSRESRTQSKQQPTQGLELGFNLLHNLKEAERRDKTIIKQTKVVYKARGILRNIYLPRNSVNVYKLESCRNFLRHIKTTGILAASSINGRLIITHLIIPKQEGSNDLCFIKNMQEVDEYMSVNKLIHAGYIYNQPHTEADLTCYEMHELCRLKMKFNEAFAIVTSNTFTETNRLCLTKDGFHHLLKCQETGVHIHKLNKPIIQYTLHVLKEDDYEIQIKDVREKNLNQIEPPNIPCNYNSC